MSKQNPAHPLGLILTRIVVPGWVLTGATFKLVGRDPKALPEQIVYMIRKLTLDADTVLAALVTIEFALAAVMLLVARLVRPTAIFTLGVFCTVLIIEMAVMGNFTSCGCLGNSPLAPWHMLLIDGLMLAGVIVFGPRAASQPQWDLRATGPVLAAVVAVAAGVISFGWIKADHSLPHDDNQPQPVPRVAQGDPGQNPPATDPDTPQLPSDSAASQPSQPVATQPVDPTVNPNPRPVPARSWYPADVSAWVGKNWREVELFQFMKTWPRDLDHGKRYVVFYSRTCDHCHDMFHYDLIMPLDAPVTAIEIPASDQVLTAPDAWEMPETSCELLALPLGKWLMTPPLALRIENGIVTCATEGDHKTCLGIP